MGVVGRSKGSRGALMNADVACLISAEKTNFITSVFAMFHVACQNGEGSSRNIAWFIFKASEFSKLEKEYLENSQRTKSTLRKVSNPVRIFRNQCLRKE